MFLIVDFKYAEQQEDPKTSKFNNKSQVIDFVAEKSTESEQFEIIRINEYKEGRLIPMELKFIKGRIDLVEVPGELRE